MGTTGTSFLVEADRSAAISAVAPDPNIRLVRAALVAVVAFNDPLRLETMVGAALIVASNLGLV